LKFHHGCRLGRAVGQYSENPNIFRIFGVNLGEYGVGREKTLCYSNSDASLASREKHRLANNLVRTSAGCPTGNGNSRNDFARQL
jgi:hypothetical protein